MWFWAARVWAASAFMWSCIVASDSGCIFSVLPLQLYPTFTTLPPATLPANRFCWRRVVGSLHRGKSAAVIASF